MMQTKLFVGNLAFDVAELELEDFFNQAGPVIEASLMQDPGSGKTRGFAFVTMDSYEGAMEAIRRFDGADFHGQRISVSEARAKEGRTSPQGPRRGFKPRR